jgi:hypothetical protein
MLETSDVLMLARLQFAFTISAHIIFPAISIGLASYLAVLEGLWLRTGNLVYRELFFFWSKIFPVGFGMGVVSGVVMSYEFGANCAGFLGIMPFGRGLSLAATVLETRHFILPVTNACLIPKSNRFAPSVLMRSASDINCQRARLCSVSSRFGRLAKGESNGSNKHRHETTVLWRQPNDSRDEARGACDSRIRR